MPLQCATCAAALAPVALLDAATRATPPHPWLLVDCPRCGASAVLEVGEGTLALGRLDGAPGPCFFADSTAEVPGLRVRVRGSGVTVTMGARRWVVRG